MGNLTDYKQTEIGRIPKEWEVVRLGDKEVAEIRKGKSINEINRFDNVAFIPMEFVPDTGIFVNFEIRSIKDVKSFTYCEKGDLLLAKITPSLENGKQGIVPDTVPNGFALTTTEVFPIVCSGIERLFLFYVLKHSKFRNKIIASMTGTTGRQRATKISVQNLLLPLPPLPEQRKIAEILSTVDEAIEKVDEAIAKTERLKKGLMQNLLTKGIGHKEFKDTEIGRIPKEWKVVRLKDAEEMKLIMGQSPPGKSYNRKGEGIPFIQGKAEFGSIYPSPVLWTSQPTKIAEEGDILISVRAPVGEVNICPYRLCIGRGLAAIRIRKGSNMFYFYWFQKVRQHIEKIGKGSTFKAITKNELTNLFLPFPPLPEQKKIAEILSTVDKRLELLKNKKEKLKRIKKGLMNDLLTGKRRVKV